MLFLNAGYDIWFIIGGIIICVIVALAIVLSFFGDRAEHKRFLKNVQESSNSLRVFVIDSKNDRVSYFNRSRLQKRKSSTMTEFYNQFPANERSKIITWVSNLLNNVPDTPNFLEINVLVNYNKKSFFSLLQVEKVDRSRGLVYLESYLLRYMYAQKTKNSQVRKFVSHEKFASILTNTASSKGVTISINFFNKRTYEETVPYLLFAQIKNVLVPYITVFRPMLEQGDNRIIISDLKAANKTNIIALANTLKNEISRLLMITSNQERVGFTFGVVENKYFIGSIDELIKTANMLSDVAKDDKKDMVFYEEGHKVGSDNNAQHYRTEVERIIQDKKLKYLYRPIYNVARNRMLGYQLFVEPLDSFFDSIDELKTYAVRTEDDKELFATIARNSVSRFIQEKDGITLRLFFPISVNEIDYVNRTFAHISSIKEANIVLILNEDELLDLSKDTSDSLVATIKTFKSKGYEVSLMLNNKETALPSQIYDSFDYFLISVVSHITAKKSQGRQLPSFQSLIEKLLKYDKPIVATNIPNWELVGYIIKLGVELVSSESISPSSENVLPLSKKSLTKLKNMN